MKKVQFENSKIFQKIAIFWETYDKHITHMTEHIRHMTKDIFSKTYDLLFFSQRVSGQDEPNPAI